MSEWRDVTLGEIFEISSSKRVLQEDWKSSGVPFYRAREIVKLAKDGTVDNELFISEELYETFRGQSGVPKAGDLMVSAVGTLGACYVVKATDRFYYKDASVLRMSPKREICARFIWHAFQTQEVIDQIHAGSGSTVGTYTIQRANKTKIRLPPVSEQRRIASILDQADALRAKRQKAVAQLDSLTQSIFIEMFGDPVANTKGWPQCKLQTVASLINGRAFKPDEWEDDGLPIIRIQNLNDDTKPFNYTNQVLPEKFKVRPNEILFSWSGTPGTSFGCFRWRGGEGWLNQHIFKVLLDEKRLDGDFFIQQMNLKLGELISQAHGGVGLQHVTKGMIDETLLLLPTLALQKEYSNRLQAVNKLEKSGKGSLRELENLFASVQHRAFRGAL